MGFGGFGFSMPATCKPACLLGRTLHEHMLVKRHLEIFNPCLMPANLLCFLPWMPRAGTGWVGGWACACHHGTQSHYPYPTLPS